MSTPTDANATDERKSTSGRGYSRPALEAWEEMFRATTTIARDLAAGEAWGELSQAEYGVLYTLSKTPTGVRICELGSDVLLTQTGLSRLVGRLVDKGLIERNPDPSDGRSTLLSLTEEGRKAQKRIGRIHAREITAAMANPLSDEEMRTLASLCRRLLADAGESKAGCRSAGD